MMIVMKLYNRLAMLLFAMIATWCYTMIIGGADTGELSLISVLPSILLILLFVGSRVIMVNKTVDWLSPAFIFLGLFYIFHFGYLYLYLLGYANYDSEVFYNSKYTVTAVYFCTLCAASFLFGYGFLGGESEEHALVSISGARLAQLYFSSKILLVIALLMFWLPILSVFEAAFSDYTVLISIGESPLGKLYWVGQYLGVAALSVFYTCKGRLRPKIFSDFFSWLALFYILGYLFIGDRGGFLYFGIIPILATNLFWKKLSGSKIALAAIAVLVVSSVIAVSRSSSIYNPFSAYETYTERQEGSAVTESIKEFGLSFKTVPIAMTLVPNQFDYWYGQSYWDGFLIAFPNFFGKRYSSGVDTWLTETAFGPLSETHGRGGSIVMESYVNFGVLGSGIFFIGLGYIVGALYKKVKVSSSVFYAVLYFSLMAAICLWMRNTSVVVFRTVIWSLLFYWFAYFISSSKLVRVKFLK